MSKRPTPFVPLSIVFPSPPHCVCSCRVIYGCTHEAFCAISPTTIGQLSRVLLLQTNKSAHVRFYRRRTRRGDHGPGMKGMDFSVKLSFALHTGNTEDKELKVAHWGLAQVKTANRTEKLTFLCRYP